MSVDSVPADVSGQTAADVKARLEAEGYTLSEVTEDEIFERMVEAEYPLWLDARLYSYDSDNIWVVYSSYDATVEWGSRLDALADTLEIKKKGEEEFNEFWR